jgi:hypothetical protein
MPTDRGTLPRGRAGRGDEPATWPQPTTPAARRLPGVARERRPALAALAVLLILGGALGAGFLVLKSGQRVTAIEIARTIGTGQQIPLSAMQPVQIPAASGLPYVPWADAAEVSRSFTIGVLPPGTLLTRAMVAATGNALAGRAVLGLALKDGQLPRGLQDGDHVDIYQVSDAQDTCPGGPGATLSGNAVVLAIGQPAASSASSAVADVQVAIDPADAGVVACNAANGLVGIAVLPAAGAGVAAPAPGGTTPRAPAPSGTG